MRSPLYILKIPSRPFRKRYDRNNRVETFFLFLLTLFGLLSDPLHAWNRRYTVFVIHESWHTGIVIRSADVQEPLRNIISDITDHPFIEFGWGDAEYFQSTDPTIGMALRAVLWPTPSVMQVYKSLQHPTERKSVKKVMALKLTAEEMKNLCRAIADSFELDSLNRPIQTNDWGTVVFFKAKEKYHLLNMCNHWTARMLQQAGLPISDIGAFTAEIVMQRLEDIVSSLQTK